MSYFKTIIRYNHKLLCYIAAATSIHCFSRNNNNFISTCDKKKKLIKSDWIDCYTNDGKVYFYNSKTLETSWKIPTVVNNNKVVENNWDTNWDMREEIKEELYEDPKDEIIEEINEDLTDEIKQKDEKKKELVNHHIILIRHGQYEQNNGNSDEKRVLTELGREQARITGRRLKELSDAKLIHPIKYIYYSTMTRATETHNLIMESLLDENILKHNIQPCSMIKEGAVCRPDPKHITWLPTDEDFFKDGVRVHAGFVNHIHRASVDEDANYTTVLVCHGNVIRYYMLKALQLPTNAWLRTSVANSSISMLSISPDGGVSCTNFGDSGHLPANRVTFN